MCCFRNLFKIISQSAKQKEVIIMFYFKNTEALLYFYYNSYLIKKLTDSLQGSLIRFNEKSLGDSFLWCDIHENIERVSHPFEVFRKERYIIMIHTSYTH